ncbi:MAG: flagellar motor switch protein FliN [Oscillospiraceae bacterium]|nr:flagellar motor switch protein FliN [Oscillospiraceae bacterium]
MGESIFSPVVIDAIGEIMNISLGSSATAVSNMLDHRVDITTPVVQVVNAEEFVLGEIDPAVGVEIKYVTGLDGRNIMMLKRSDVKAIVDILLGSETPDEEFVLDELSISCVCEVMNQMMGAAATAMSDFLGMVVNISTPESFEMDDLDQVRREHFPVERGPVVVVQFKLYIEGILESEFMNVISVELARDMLKGFGIEVDLNASAADAAAAPAAPAPEPAADSGKKMSQEEIEALLSGGAAAPAVPAPEPAADSGKKMSQEEIEALLSGGAAAAPAAPAPAPAQPAPAPAPQPAAAPAQGQAPAPGQVPPGYPPYPYPYPAPEQGGYPYPPYPPYMYAPAPQPAPAPAPAEPKVIKAQPARMQELGEEARLNQEQKQNLDLIMSVSLEVAVEIGRTRRKIQDIIAFSKGSLVVLDKLAGDQVDLLVNGQCIARGDVVVIDDNFGIRITEILDKPDINELAKP